MKSKFNRALVGFCILTCAVAGMSMVALWAIEAFVGGAWWASGIVVLMALCAEIMLYSSTLHEPIYDWIKSADDWRQAEIDRLKDEVKALQSELMQRPLQVKEVLEGGKPVPEFNVKHTKQEESKFKPDGLA